MAQDCVVITVAELIILRVLPIDPKEHLFDFIGGDLVADPEMIGIVVIVVPEQGRSDLRQLRSSKCNTLYHKRSVNTRPYFASCRSTVSARLGTRRQDTRSGRRHRERAAKDRERWRLSRQQALRTVLIRRNAAS